MKPSFKVKQYKAGKWAVFDRISRCYIVFGTKRRTKRRCAALNGV